MTKRKLVIDGITFYWHCGSTFVPIWRGKDKVAIPTLADITGMNWNDIDHDQHKCNFRLTPSQVTKYIRSEILT